jgi:fumarate reductase subunit C
MAARRTYVRPMAGWWKRDPFFLRYMAREATALFVVAYALVLLWGLARLAQGDAAFAGWLDALASPGAIAFHGVLLAVFLFHTWSWFRIMPKTLPPITVAGHRLTANVVTGLGLAASAGASMAMLLAFAALAA